MSWRVHTDGSPVHVWPDDDVIEHDVDSDDCICGPELEPIERDDGSFGWVIHHHSLDGRERTEGSTDG